MELAKIYPDLNFVVQDTPGNIEQAKGVWQAENTKILQTRVTLMPHDFFKENPVKNADVYVLRYIM